MACLKGLDFKVIKHHWQRPIIFGYCLPVFGLLAYWFRAIRWNLMLEPMGTDFQFQFTLVDFFRISMNLTIPRSGEVARATALYGVEKVPVDKSFGTIILERVVDLICMLCFLGLTLFLNMKQFCHSMKIQGLKSILTKFYLFLLY
jgi:uncharacterized protein (TIRG00374 family)